MFTLGSPKATLSWQPGESGECILVRVQYLNTTFVLPGFNMYSNMINSVLKEDFHWGMAEFTGSLGTEQSSTGQRKAPTAFLSICLSSIPNVSAGLPPESIEEREN